MAWWRHLALAGVTFGLGLAPTVGAPPGWLVVVGAAIPALALTRPERRGRPSAARSAAAATWLSLIAITGALAGLGAGGTRVAAITGEAAPGRAGQSVEATGDLTSQPRRSGGETRAVLETSAGRLLLVAADPPPGLRLGGRLLAEGVLAEPAPWRRAELVRAGAALELRSERIEILPGGRGGLTGLLDRTRSRAERGLTAGLNHRQAALARGFVLGQDELIDAATREQFVRSGLAHLLAVSGQNVLLLAILAGVLFSIAGVGPRARMGLVIVAIAIYVPLAGAGPSIQRAGAMGAAGIAAGLLGRPSDRAYLPLLAAAATLALNPHSAADVGWQLSFAAVIGISAFAVPLRARLEQPLERLVGARAGRPLAEAAALTTAATLATAPLMAHHFESFSLASLPANLLAFVAVAPVMWLGMLAAGLGQYPFIPLEPIGAVEGLLIDYIALVARSFSAPAWALVELPLPGALNVAALYIALAALAVGALAAARLRSGLRVPRSTRRAGLAGALALVALIAAGADGAVGPPPAGTLRITLLDVGQGDAILIEPPGSRPALVDTGPAGAGLARLLRERGIERLGDVLITHDQSDHAGALDELAGDVPFSRLVYARVSPGLLAAADRAGAETLAVGAGDEVRWSSTRVGVLWPGRVLAGANGGDTSTAPPTSTAPATSTAPGALSASEADPNLSSLVVLLEFEGWHVLLTGDAEFEATRLWPGPVDLLKLPHHGSADAGLGPVLDRAAPRLAVASLGADNRHGHPAAETTDALSERGICLLRTDLAGSISVDLGPAGMRVRAERDEPPAHGCP